MTYQDAQFFWERYLGLLSRGGCYSQMSNPLRELLLEKKTAPNAFSKEQFYQRKKDALELSAFWNHRPKEMVGNILIHALAKTNLSDEDRKNISRILADASVHTDYSQTPGDIPAIETALLDDGRWEYATPADEIPFVESESAGNWEHDWTPRKIYNYLNDWVYGQEDAKRAASMLMYHHIHKRRRNLIMAGPSGCGKTEIWRILSHRFDCIKIINGPQLACDGWKGSYHVKDIFVNEAPSLASRLVIVIDEADKLFEPAIGSGGTDHGRKIQNELLKIMDGDTVTFTDDNGKEPPCTINCQNVSLVFCGTFEFMGNQKTDDSKQIGFVSANPANSTDIPDASCQADDYIRYANVRRELMGRIDQIVTLDPLTAADFLAILNSPASPVRRVAHAHHVHLLVDEDTKTQLAETAAESGLGCRYIRSRVQGMLDEQMFDNPDASTYSLSFSNREKTEPTDCIQG